jgi:hypothetical protein
MILFQNAQTIIMAQALEQIYGSAQQRKYSNMSKQTQRGRVSKTAAKASPMRSFYILLGIIVAAGIGILGLYIYGNQPAAVAPSTPSTPSTDLPTGFTADGYPFKGLADAPVTVTEYSDYQ